MLLLVNLRRFIVDYYTYVLLTLAFLISTFINVTVAGFLTIKMFEFVEKKIFELDTDRLKGITKWRD